MPEMSFLTGLHILHAQGNTSVSDTILPFEACLYDYTLPYIRAKTAGKNMQNGNTVSVS